MSEKEKNFTDSMASIPMENFSSTAKLTEKSKEKKLSEAGEYDPFAHRDVKHPNSDFGAMAHLLKASLGTGILAMPHAMRNAGIVFGPIATVIIGLVCAHCAHILVASSQRLCRQLMRPSMTFAETAEMAFKTGPPHLQKLATFSKRFVNIALTGTYYSALCVYVVFIASSVQRVANIDLTGNETNDTRLYMVMFYVGYILLGQVRNLKFLIPFSALANLFIVVGFGITLYYVFDVPVSVENKPYVANWENMPTFFSTAIFAMEGIGVVMPLENNMTNPRHFLGCPGVLNIAMSVVVLLYSVIGFFGYLRFGDAIEASITLNLPDEPLANTVKILVAVAIFFTYGLQYYVPTDITWPAIARHVKEDRRCLLETGYRLLTVTATVALSIAIPNLGPIISLVGAVCFSTLGLLCPAIIDAATNWETPGIFKWILWKDLLISLFSILALVTGAYTSIQDIIREYD